MEEQFDLLNFSKIAHEDPMLYIKDMFSIKTTLRTIKNRMYTVRFSKHIGTANGCSDIMRNNTPSNIVLKNTILDKNQYCEKFCVFEDFSYIDWCGLREMVLMDKMIARKLKTLVCATLTP